ncbi:MAG: DUF4326 domain-containing protein [Candidatus Dormibacteria bacterium]
MSAPRRIQRQRTKGWRKPEGAVIVSRPTKWGNPFLAEPHYNNQGAVQRYRLYLSTPAGESLLAALPELRGRDLVCWCPLDAPCHADVLLGLANSLAALEGRG